MMNSLVLGDYLHVDFNAPLSWLADQGTLLCCDDLDDVRHVHVSRESPVDLIVLAQSRPGQIDCNTVDQVHRYWPLAKLVGLLGSWCEGEVRTGQPWPGVVRVYWHQWAEVLSAEVMHLQVNEPSIFGAARIAVDPLKSLAGRPRTVAVKPAQILVAATQPPAAATLLSDLKTFGFRPSREEAGVSVEAIVFDCDCAQRPELLEVAVLRSRHPGIPIVALVGFPRRDDVVALRRAGATRVLSKPYRMEDLVRVTGDLAASWRERDATASHGKAAG